MGEFGINFVDQIGKIRWSLIVNVFEEHNSSKILGKLFCILRRHFSLYDCYDILFLGRLYFFSQIYDFLLQIEESFNIFASFGDFQRIVRNNFTADFLNFCIGLICDVVNVISNGQLCTFRNNIQNVFAFHKTAILYCPQNWLFIFSWNEFLIFIFFPGLFEQEDSVVQDQKFEELLFFFFKKRSTFILQLKHFPDFSMVIKNSGILFSFVDNHYDSFFDIFEGFEWFE